MANETVVDVTHLTKDFGQVRAVDDVSFTIHPGRVTGFLGPNGAGKTTTIRLILGLISPSHGAATIGGQPISALASPATTIGSALDPRSFHPGRTARGHLNVMAPAAGVGPDRVTTVLTAVGLDAVGDRRVGTYSLGMCQRLALAAALLGDPDVLILDEPANGLDPEGIMWLRAFLRALAAEGRTVLVSSHLLTEVQHSVDDILIMARGRLVAASPLAELVDSLQRTTVLTVPESAAAAVDELATERGWTMTGAGTVFRIDAVAPAEVGHACWTSGVEVHGLTETGADLEATFLALTEGKGMTMAPGGVA